MVTLEAFIHKLKNMNHLAQSYKQYNKRAVLSSFCRSTDSKTQSLCGDLWLQLGSLCLTSHEIFRIFGRVWPSGLFSCFFLEHLSAEKLISTLALVYMQFACNISF